MWPWRSSIFTLPPPPVPSINLTNGIAELTVLAVARECCQRANLVEAAGVDKLSYPFPDGEPARRVQARELLFASIRCASEHRRAISSTSAHQSSLMPAPVSRGTPLPGILAHLPDAY
ncbi:MAG: hypothetical protein ACRDRN_26525 [Sciscionella sp.]